MNALLITFVFLSFFFFLIRGLINFSRKSTGDKSPLSQRVTYQITAWQYFTRFDFLSLIILVAMILALLCTLFVKALPAAKTGWHYLALLSFFSTNVWFLYYLRICFRLNDQYGQLTRDVIVTLDPADKRMTIESPEETVSFVASDIQEIERIGAGFNSSKMVSGYEYWRFTLIDGYVAYLNANSSYLTNVLEVYFPRVPTTYHARQIPWVDRSASTESDEE
jgi:hypothetical protein